MVEGGDNRTCECVDRAYKILKAVQEESDCLDCLNCDLISGSLGSDLVPICLIWTSE